MSMLFIVMQPIGLHLTTGYCCRWEIRCCVCPATSDKFID